MSYDIVLFHTNIVFIRVRITTTETCKECAATVEEDSGRWLILDQSKDDGFDWMFLCIQCVRDWRQRGLEREELSSKEVVVQLDREYPITQSN